MLWTDRKIGLTLGTHHRGGGNVYDVEVAFRNSIPPARRFGPSELRRFQRWPATPGRASSSQSDGLTLIAHRAGFRDRRRHGL